MATLLHVECSPRKDRSVSIAVAREFLDAYRAANPGDRIETLDLWAVDLPRFDGDVLDAKYAILHGKDHTPEQAAAWQAVVDVFERFAAADKYLFSLPMWNFGVPYKVKHFIDVITQPGLAFSFSPESGYTGLVTGRPAAAVYARGGEYPPNSPQASYDMQKPYLELWLAFIGFTDVRSVVAEPTLDPDKSAEARESARRQARELGESF